MYYSEVQRRSSGFAERGAIRIYVVRQESNDTECVARQLATL